MVGSTKDFFLTNELTFCHLLTWYFQSQREQDVHRKASTLASDADRWFEAREKGEGNGPGGPIPEHRVREARASTGSLERGWRCLGWPLGRPQKPNTSSTLRDSVLFLPKKCQHLVSFSDSFKCTRAGWMQMAGRFCGSMTRKVEWRRPPLLDSNSCVQTYLFILPFQPDQI